MLWQSKAGEGFAARDFTIDCNCVIIYPSIAQSVSTFDADPVEAAFGTYTEITSTPATGNRRVTFTGYTSTYTVGSSRARAAAKVDR